MKLLVGQSGGPTVAINASLAGVIASTIKKNAEVYGMLHGIEGLFKEAFIDLSIYQDQLDILKTTPAMALGSCRYKLKSSDLPILTNILLKNNFTHLIYIGGNDSMDTVLKLSNYFKENNVDIKVIGVPKTIDNDLAVTDHSPGFPSAAKYVFQTLKDIYYDMKIYDTKTVVIVEIMGRDTGWLTLAAGLHQALGHSYPSLVYYPEIPFDKNDFLNDVKNELADHTHVLVAVAEGIKDKFGNYLFSKDCETDVFNHQQLGGELRCLEKLVKDSLNVKCRFVELSVLQRSAMKHASKVDIEEAYEIGFLGAKLALENHSGKVMIFERNESPNYQMKIGSVDAYEIANKVKHVPLEIIKSKELTIKYLLPLLKDEPDFEVDSDNCIKYLELR